MTDLEALSPRTRALDELLCPMTSEATGFAVCGRAWRAGSQAREVAMHYSWLGIEHDGAAHGVDMAATFAEAQRRFGTKLPGEVLHNEALRLARQGLDRQSAETEVAAWAHGYAHREQGDDDLDQARYRPLTVRLQSAFANWGPARYVAVAWSALSGGSVDGTELYLQAAFARSVEEVDPAVRGWLFAVRDLARLAAFDRMRGALDPAGLADLLAATRKESFEQLTAMTLRYPHSDLVQLLLAEELPERGRLWEALTNVQILHQRHPELTTLSIDLISYLGARGRYREARELLAKAKAREPSDARLDELTVPDLPDGTDESLPPTLTSPDALRAALGAVTDRQLQALDPVVQGDLSIGAEVAFADAWDAHRRFALGREHEGVSVAVMSEARASHCEPLQCIEQVHGQYAKIGLRVAWTAPIDLPLGAGAISLVRGPGTVLITTILPLGERVHSVFIGGPATRVEHELAAIRLAIESFRPLDSVIGSPATQVLRSEERTAKSSVSGWARFSARRSALVPQQTCPLSAELAEIRSEELKSWLALDAYLSTPSVEARKALLRCGSPSAVKARLGLVLLWDEDPELHDLGAGYVRAAPEQAIAQFGRLEPTLGNRALSARGEETEEHPPFGLVELITALPESARKKFSRDRLEHGSKLVQAGTLAGLALAGDSALDDAWLERTRTASPAELQLLLLAARRDPRARDLIRARVDALQLGTPAELELAHVLAHYLAEQRQVEDRRRLAQLEERALALRADSDHTRAIQWSVKLHSASLDETIPSTDPNRQALLSELASVRALSAAAPSAERIKALASRTLPELLPGKNWSYYRVSRPELLLSGVHNLHERLGAKDNPERLVALSMMRALVENAGGELLKPDAGLDWSRPIECASLDHLAKPFVCSGYASSVMAMRRALARRTHGHDAGVALLMHAGRGAVFATVAAPMLPGAIHVGMFGTSTTQTESSSAIIGRERARMEISLRGVSLQKMATLQSREDGTARIDSEVYLFSGSRWFVFATQELAHWLLAPGASPMLAQDPRFRAVTASWREGGALQAYLLNEGSPSSLELAVRTDGLMARIRRASPEPLRDVSPLLRALPEGAVARFADGNSAELRQLLSSLRVDARAGAFPPASLFDNARGVAFGWYPKPSGPLWGHWVILVERDDVRSQRAPGLHVAQRGSVWVVASDANLLTETLTRFDLPRDRRERPVMSSGQVDGLRAGAFIAKLWEGQPMDKRAMALRGISSLVRIARDLKFEGSSRGGVHTVEAELLPELASATEDARVVDAMLHDTRSKRNAVQLAVPVKPEWRNKGLRIRLRGDNSADSLLRAFPETSRVRAASSLEGGEGEIVIQVRPGRQLDEPAEELHHSAQDLAKLLEQDGEIRPDHARIVSLTREVVGSSATAPDKVAAVVHWVGKHLRYEIRPEVIDAVEILDSSRGDCTEFATLAVSMLRAAGIPSQVRMGLMLVGSELVAHAWVSYFDGHGFREVDPTTQRLSVDAGYIEASMLDLAALLSLDDVRVVDVAELQ